jgi:predicted AAA+ superfamily ATPase
MPGQGILELFPRHAAAMVSAALADTRVVVINGARQVGKSTLAEITADTRGDTRTYYLDDDLARSAAADPASFVDFDGLLVIDEIQRAPEIAGAVADARLITIPAGHRVHSRAPDRLLAEVVPFLIA